jgi:hypothetical protein
VEKIEEPEISVAETVSEIKESSDLEKDSKGSENAPKSIFGILGTGIGLFYGSAQAESKEIESVSRNEEQVAFDDNAEHKDRLSDANVSQLDTPIPADGDIVDEPESDFVITDNASKHESPNFIPANIDINNVEEQTENCSNSSILARSAEIPVEENTLNFQEVPNDELQLIVESSTPTLSNETDLSILQEPLEKQDDIQADFAMETENTNDIIPARDEMMQGDNDFNAPLENSMHNDNNENLDASSVNSPKELGPVPVQDDESEIEAHGGDLLPNKKEELSFESHSIITEKTTDEANKLAMESETESGISLASKRSSEIIRDQISVVSDILSRLERNHSIRK